MKNVYKQSDLENFAKTQNYDIEEVFQNLDKDDLLPKEDEERHFFLEELNIFPITRLSIEFLTTFMVEKDIEYFTLIE